MICCQSTTENHSRVSLLGLSIVKVLLVIFQIWILLRRGTKFVNTNVPIQFCCRKWIKRAFNENYFRMAARIEWLKISAVYLYCSWKISIKNSRFRPIQQKKNLLLIVIIVHKKISISFIFYNFAVAQFYKLQSLFCLNSTSFIFC